MSQKPLPSLPEPCAYGAAARIGEVIYLAGGQSGLALDTATGNFWRLDCRSGAVRTRSFRWEICLPGKGRRGPSTRRRLHNGFDDWSTSSAVAA